VNILWSKGNFKAFFQLLRQTADFSSCGVVVRHYEKFKYAFTRLADLFVKRSIFLLAT
jgi:hypothetical protein